MSPSSTADQSFGGKRVNVVQIGLGTFGTFVQNLAGEECDVSVEWLLKACSEQRPEWVTGVAVEPVREHLDRLRPHTCKLPYMELVQVAIGKDDAKDELHFLSDDSYKAALDKVPACRREALEAQLVYMRNMSCVGMEHPALESMNEWLGQTFGFRVPTQPVQITVWSYGRLATELGFCGCEVLMIDAEGYDTQILRSMVAHCRSEAEEARDAWPHVVQFESMGHCDDRAGTGDEANMRKQLEECGYICIMYSWYNSILVRRKALSCRDSSQRLAELVGSLRCVGCTRTGADKAILPFTIDEGFWCRPCYAAWWGPDWLWELCPDN